MQNDTMTGHYMPTITTNGSTTELEGSFTATRR
jgi:hypothetical protein